jgi:hypothetical protein
MYTPEPKIAMCQSMITFCFPINDGARFLYIAENPLVSSFLFVTSPLKRCSPELEAFLVVLGLEI